MRTHGIFRTLGVLLLSSILLTVGLQSDLYSQRASSISPFINPEAPAGIHEVFGPGGMFTYAGGVMFQGRVQFYQMGSTRQESVAPSAVNLRSTDAGVILLQYGSRRQPLDLQVGLACPLGRFISRGGVVAYTQPESITPEVTRKLRAAGLVESEYYEGAYVAREFRGTPFESLLAGADFFDVQALPSELASTILRNLNSALGSGRQRERSTKWYVNTDIQVTYQARMSSAAKPVAFGGAPLRYFWSYATDGSAIVDSVKAMTLASRSLLTRFESQDVEPTQYDILALYRAASTFRQLYMSNPSAFAEFVATSCGAR